MTPAQYRRLLDVIMQPLAAAVLAIVLAALRSSGTVEQKKGRIVKAALPEVRAARRRAWIVAGQLLSTEARRQGVTGPLSIPAPPGYADEALEKLVNDVFDVPVPKPAPGKEPAQIRPARQLAQEIASGSVRHAENAARQTIETAPAADHTQLTQDDVIADDFRPFVLIGLPPPKELFEELKPTEKKRKRPVGWARMLTGADNCAFCVMLASRGAVYASAETAGRIPASLKFADAQGWLNSYHDNCDCIAVAVYTSRDWVGKQQAADLYKLWLTATKGTYQKDALNALRRHLQEMQKNGEQIVPDLRAAA